MSAVYAFPWFENVDTARIVDKRYPNGQVRQVYFLNDSLWTDSLIKYHENGNVSMRIVISHYTPLQGEWKVNYLPSYHALTYYPSGKLRSEEFNNYLDNEWLSIHSSFVKETADNYTTKYIYGDTVEGLFILKVLEEGSSPIVEYGRYENHKLLDRWVIKGRLPTDPVILKVVDEETQKVLITDDEIQKSMSRFCFYYIDYNFGMVKIYH